VRRFLAHFRPSAGILIETEVWPNLAALCAEQGVPLALANARLSEKSLSRARKLPGLSRRAYGSLRAVWAQTETDARRLAEAGATVQGVFGNLKFDATPDPAQLRLGRDWRATVPGPVVMFSSSREGEEADFLAALRAHAGVQWLLVPRHPQRFDEVAAQVVQAGFTVSRRSTWTAAPTPAEVWLGDSLGEMPLYYALADVALLGGSFAPLGGQNLIEAAACGCPVVMGPHTFNFADAAELALDSGAAFRVDGMQDGIASAVTLTRDVGRLRQAARAGEKFAERHRGAAVKTAIAVMGMLT
jgi:3-deoxy-D-manno-octulosonic-acid transferase